MEDGETVDHGASGAYGFAAQAKSRAVVQSGACRRGQCAARQSPLLAAASQAARTSGRHRAFSPTPRDAQSRAVDAERPRILPVSSRRP